MKATDLIARLASLEKSAAKCGDRVTRDFVIEAQDCILRMQRENLELRSENHVLRLRQSPRREESRRPSSLPAAAPPLIFRPVPSQPSPQAKETAALALSPGLSRAV